MPRTTGRGKKADKSRGVRKSRKRDRGRRTTLRGRTKNMRGGWKTCFKLFDKWGEDYKPYLVKKYCNFGDTPEDQMKFYSESRWNGHGWYYHPTAQIKEYSKEDQARLEDPDLQKKDPDLFALRARFPSIEEWNARAERTRAAWAVFEKNKAEREAAEKLAERERIRIARLHALNWS
jgi:hypothetical protein